MPDPHPFRVAAETKDLDLMRETLAEDVTFHSPVVFKAYEGLELTMVILSNVVEIFEDFRYLDEARGDGTLVLRFVARVDDKYEIEGVDYITLDAEDRVADLTVFMRPQKAVLAFNELMGARLGAAPPA
ncbi:MAG TPA: nuclear transport factor 2 family protein [Solirubrobacterales bacterium]|nr:nuclear transport factor 2 family protein [Solirubrobacterales bacterium]